MLEPDSDDTDTLAEKCTKEKVFNIMDLARTTDQALIPRTRQNVQKCRF